MLSKAQLESWNNDGMLILEQFYGEDALNAVERTMREVWDRRDARVVVDDLVTNRRCLMSALNEEERTHRFKTNDLYLTEDAIRQLAMGQRMSAVISQLLGEPAV